MAPAAPRRQGERDSQSCLHRCRRKLLLLHGRGNGKDCAGYPVPTPPAFERAAPEPPDWLDDEGRDEWQRVVDDLAPLGLLKNSDRATLTA